MTHSTRHFHAPAALLPAALALVFAAVPRAGAAPTPEERRAAVKLEVRYVNLLNEAGLAEYADLVLKDVQAKFPEAKVILKTAALEQTLRLGRFDEAKKIIAAEPDQEAPETWAMKLLMADYYFTRGRYQEADGIYLALFKKYGSAPPAGLTEFYAQSYYKFSQMLIFLGRETEAIDAYRKLLAIKDLEEQTFRQATFELAQLLVKRAGTEQPPARGKTLEEARTFLNKLFWKQDLWFGRAVALLAHMRVVEGKPETAQKLVDGYMEQLEAIDETLEQEGKERGVDLSSLSPIAECRYLLGTILADEADKLLAEIEKMPDKAPKERKAREDAETKAVGMFSDALGNLVNVYVQYPTYAWALEAMDRVEKIEATLDGLGYEVESNISPQQRAQVAKKQFETAASLFKQRQFEKSIETYESILRKYPETTESPAALSTLAQACTDFAATKEGDPDGAWFYQMYAAAVAGTLAERWANKPRAEMTAAGDLLRGLVQYFTERNLHEVAEKTLEDFFRLYPRHTMAAQSLLAEASKRADADPPDWDGAISHYKILVENYGTAEQSYKAHRRLADAYAKLGKVDLALDTRSNYLARVEADNRPADEILMANYAYARALRDKVATDLRAATVAWDEARRGVASSGAAPSLLDEEPGEQSGDEESADSADPEKAARRALVAANKAVGPVITRYAGITKLLRDPEKRKRYDVNAEQKAMNDTILQVSLFDYAYLLSSLNQPAKSLPKYKKAAIDAYESILAAFPQAENAPAVLLQLGTLYSTVQAETDEERAANAKKAASYFDRLAAEYPDSDQAKNALYLQGKALMELGFRNEAISKFKEMIGSSGGKYSATQLQSAAQELFKAKEYGLAEQGYSAAWAKTKDDDSATRASISLGRAEILVAQAKYLEAAEALDKFIEENPRSWRILDANEMLCRACVQATLAENDADAREKLFARAIKAVRAMRPYKRDAKGELQIQLEIGTIVEAQAKVESKHGNEERALKYKRDAWNHYNKQIMSIDRRNADIRPELEQILARGVQALVACGTYVDGSTIWPDVRDICAEYLDLFPSGPHVMAVRQALSDANVQIATSGDEAPAGSTLSSITAGAEDIVDLPDFSDDSDEDESPAEPAAAPAEAEEPAEAEAEEAEEADGEE